MPPDAPAATDENKTGNDYGFDADEQAAFESMRSEPRPQGDAGFEAPPPADAGAPAAPEPKDPPTPPPAPGATAPSATAAPGAAATAPPAAGGPAGGAADADGDDDELDPTPNADGTAKPPKRVSFNKFKRAQDELEAMKAANAKLTSDQTRLDERLRMINEALQTPAPATPAEPVDDDPEPDPEKDIFGHNQWLKRQLVKTQTALNDFKGSVESGQQASAAEQELTGTYMADAERFAGEEPNFLPAYDYLMQVRIAQLAHYHFGVDVFDPNVQPLTIQQVNTIKREVAREETQLVSKAIKAGKSPAAAIYAMARMTGYKPRAAQAANGGAAPAAEAKPNGAAPPTGAAATAAAAVAAAPPAAPAPGNGAAPAQAKPSVKDEIKKIQEGQDAALTLSGGGGAPAPVLDARKLADMPDDQFGELLERMSRGDLRRIMGES